jgi:hypothetical protein
MVVFCGGMESLALYGYNMCAPGFDAGYICHGVQQSLDKHSVSTFQHAQTALATC